MCIVLAATKPMHDPNAECLYSQDIVIVALARARHGPQGCKG